jgi:RNA polymerase sigma factor (sigma-70 family)
MAKQPLNGVLQHLRKVAAVQTHRGLSDCDLLERFGGAHDDAAFTVLIERHGPMVFGVCRRALPNFHDAEDACQATFLVLARKAASVRKKTSLSSWLHGVACRVAAKLTRDHARRKSREHEVDAPAPKDPAAEVTWREVQTILDDELEQLPERYRAPVILCYLECLTRDDAAKQLGLSPGSLHGRLERGRGLLRERLIKRGLTFSAVISAAALGESVSQAALAPTFVVSSTKAALLLAAGQPLTPGVVATHVLALTQEVLKTMFLTKLKLGTAALLCAGLCAALIGGSFTSLSIAQDAKPKLTLNESNFDIGPAKAESDADFIRRISKDLRGTDPTPTEIHFFVASKDAGRRQKLIDLFIQERQAKKEADANMRVRLAAAFLLAEMEHKQPAPLHYYPDEKQRDLKKQLQDFENELRKKWEKESDATKAKLLQPLLEHYRERVRTMEVELRKLEKKWKEEGKKQKEAIQPDEGGQLPKEKANGRADVIVKKDTDREQIFSFWVGFFH